jgi:putative endonuclease
MHNLVFYEVHEEMEYAIMREKQIKSWSRKRKMSLIETKNSDWTELYSEII